MIGDIDDLGLGADDESIATYSAKTDSLILTQDDDFFTRLDTAETAGVLFQTDDTLSARAVGDIVHEISEHIDQADVDLEFISTNWL